MKEYFRIYRSNGWDYDKLFSPKCYYISSLQNMFSLYDLLILWVLVKFKLFNLENSFYFPYL